MMNNPLLNHNSIVENYKKLVHSFQNDPYLEVANIEEKNDKIGFSSLSFGNYFIVIENMPVPVEFARQYGGYEVEKTIGSWNVKKARFLSRTQEIKKKIREQMSQVDNVYILASEVRRFIIWSIIILVVIGFLLKYEFEKMKFLRLITCFDKNPFKIFIFLSEYGNYKEIRQYIMILIPSILLLVFSIFLLMSVIVTIIKKGKLNKIMASKKKIFKLLEYFDGALIEQIEAIDHEIQDFWVNKSKNVILKRQNYGKRILEAMKNSDISNNKKCYISVPEFGIQSRRWVCVFCIILLVLSRTEIYTKAVQGSDQVISLYAKQKQLENNYIPVTSLQHGGHYYAIYDDAESWEDAKSKCEILGGHLATVTTEEENTKIYAYMLEQGYKEAYMGLYMKVKKSGKEVWKWITKEKLSYKNWTIGEPDSDGGEDYCGAYGRNDLSEWRAYSPSHITTYICEWDSIEDGEIKDIEELESDFGGESGNIYDRAKILTKSEIQKLNKEIVDASKEAAIDFYIVTTNDLQEKSITRYMEDFADEHNFTNVAILCISFQPPRGFEIQGYGSAMYCLTHEKINLIFDDMQDDLTNGNYYKACSTFVQEAKQYQLIGGNTISQKSKFEKIYLVSAD